MSEQNQNESNENKVFDQWVDEYFSNSSIDLDILQKAFDALRKDPQ